MHEELLTGIAIVVGLGLVAQWIAWRINLPSILLLLIFGIVAGPITGILDVDHLLGDLLFPIVSLSVGIILFEGGLSLRLADLREIGSVVRNLNSIGVLVTWVIGAIAAYVFFELSLEIAILLGAILVVTGPTVVIPLLNQIRPAARVNSILRWEGILIDPVGAVLAVLVFEQILSGETQFLGLIWNLVKTGLIGIVIGFIVARILVEAFSRYMVPEHLENPITLAALIGAFALSNVLQAESGLVTATVMGVVMANQKRFDVLHIVEFKEILQVLLISILFILLAARLDLMALSEVGGGVILFIATLMFVARPLSVWVSSIGSGLSWKEIAFLSWMAPRGIVAASVASVFAFELVDHGIPEAEILVPVTFSVIIVTVTIYGLSAGWLARRLGVSQENPQGVLIVGAHRWARRIGAILRAQGFEIVLADSNQKNIDRAVAQGFRTYRGNILSERVVDEVDLSGIGYMLAMTSNDEVNSLASLQFRNMLGTDNVFQLLSESRPAEEENILYRFGGQGLFSKDITYNTLATYFSDGYMLEVIPVNDVESIQGQIETNILPLFVITADDELSIWTSQSPPRLQPQTQLIGLVHPSAEAFVQQLSEETQADISSSEEVVST